MTILVARNKFSFSLDGEIYEGDYSSFEEAADAAMEEARGEFERSGEAQEAWVGRLELTPLTEFIDGESILSGISERVQEHVGDFENGDVYLEELLWSDRGGQSEEAYAAKEKIRAERVAQLEQLVSDWIGQYQSTEIWGLVASWKIELEEAGVVA